MRRALCALLVICVAFAALITVSHGHFGEARCELCVTVRSVDAPAPPPALPEPTITRAEPAPMPSFAIPRAADVLSYSPKNSPPPAIG